MQQAGASDGCPAKRAQWRPHTQHLAHNTPCTRKAQAVTTAHHRNCTLLVHADSTCFSAAACTTHTPQAAAPADAMPAPFNQQLPLNYNSSNRNPCPVTAIPCSVTNHMANFTRCKCCPSVSDTHPGNAPARDVATSSVSPDLSKLPLRLPAPATNPPSCAPNKLRRLRP
jgi:hypothetical protein